MVTHHFIVATAGHVDHGKSALVKALTGVDPDRLPEEKARGITIDLGFAHLELPVSGTQNQEGMLLSLGIVDVPGHEDFVKNMVTGVGSIDLALLVIAADDGWMPQTEEHLQILSYLGVTRAVVALTKIDLVQADPGPVIAAVQARLAGSPFAQAPIVPTSVTVPQGLNELKSALAEALAVAPRPPDIGKPRLPIDRVFTLKGIGTVVTGTLTGGSFRRGQVVTHQPSGQSTRVRTIQTHSHEIETSAPGMRTALNLADLSVAAKGTSDAGARRGEIVVLPGLGGANDLVDVLLTKSARLAGANSPAARPLKDGTRVRWHHGSGYYSARVLLLGTKELAPGDQALAQIRLEAPIYAFVGDRFIVRDWAEQATLAGGVILDSDARREVFRSPAQRELLQARAAAPRDALIAVSSQLQRDKVASRAALLLKSNFGSQEISDAVTRLVELRKLISLGGRVADADWWNRLRGRAADAVRAEHKAHPEHVGLALNTLRGLLAPELPDPDLCDALVEDMCQHGFVRAGLAIKAVSHHPTLPPRLQASGDRLRALLRNKLFEPPSRKELTTAPFSSEALRFLLETGEVVELGEDVVLLDEGFNGMRQGIIQYLRQRGPATVSELRQMLNTTRRVIMPMLERLDREGVTLRQGDKRSLRARSN